MNPLIGVISYQGDAENGNHDAIRQSWGRDVKTAGGNLLFFVGRRTPTFKLKPDEIGIPWQQTRKCQHEWWMSVKGCCEDFWQPLTKQAVSHAYRNGYDYIFLCENDTFLVPKKLFESDYWKYDFSGHMMQGDEKYPWPEPGVGYFLSRRAMKRLIAAEPNHLSVGIYAGQALGPLVEKGELTRESLPNFINKVSWHFRGQSEDFARNGYPPGSPWQQEMYRKYGI